MRLSIVLALVLSSAAHGESFRAWLTAHPEVSIASVLRDEPIVAARWTDDAGTVLCGSWRTTQACVRTPEKSMHLRVEGSRRRADGTPVLLVALRKGDEPGARFDIRMPEGVVVRRGQKAPLPSVPAPAWLTEPSLGVGAIDPLDDPWLDVTQADGEHVCHRETSGWRCTGTIPSPSVEAIEPGLRARDRRVPDLAPEIDGVQQHCEGTSCTLLLAWGWSRILIAHSYWARGRIAQLLHVDGNQVQALGLLRVAASTLGFNRNRTASGRATLDGARCVRLADELEADEDRSYGDRLDATLVPAAGRYCASASGFVDDSGHAPVAPHWP